MKQLALWCSSLPILILTASVLGCSKLPRDPEHTLEHIQQSHHVRIGVAEYPPWVVRTHGEPAGAEVALVRQFTATLGATPDWFWGAEQQLMESLERFELDLVIAGLSTSTPWTKEIGVTKPYFEERIIVGVPPTRQPPTNLSGLTVAVTSGDATAGFLSDKHAYPVRVSEISTAHALAAAPDWRLRKLGFTLTRFELFHKKHVMAVPPGENGWLKRLEEFLHQQSLAHLYRLLEQNETPQ